MFDVRCILCGADDRLSKKLADSETFFCHACNQEFTISDVKTWLDEWQRLFEWLEHGKGRQNPLEQSPLERDIPI
jgi:transposase-like protein